jgi:circadian clock protein KaiC
MRAEGLERLSSGVDALDEVLHGGFVTERTYMLRGPPGAGKSLLGGQFLAADPENSLYITFEESASALRTNAATLGIDLSSAAMLDLSPASEAFVEGGAYDLFAPDELEGGEVTEAIVSAVKEHEPERVFIDPLSYLRHFAPDDYRFRTEVSGFMRYLKERGATVLFATQPVEGTNDDDLQFLADGSISLSRDGRWRTLSVEKFRGSGFESGSHTLRITGDGVSVYPSLVPSAHSQPFDAETLGVGVPEFDDLLGGGIERGTVTIIAGPSGVGKSTTGTQFAAQAAERGERAALYLFEESGAVFRHRSEAVGIPVGELESEGSLQISEIEPLERSPDEFAAAVREEVEKRDTSVVMLDGISGYRLSMLGESERVVRELHALCRYLRNMGVTVVLVDETSSVTGNFEVTSERTSYLADNVLFLRYFEANGEIRKAAGVLKKRAGDFERTLREFRITEEGVTLGDPLTGMRGVLTGTPDWNGSEP